MPLDPPPTLKICEACGSHGDDCIWCTNGYQTLQQRKIWHEYRVQIRTRSSTHSILQEIVEEVISKLEATNDETHLTMTNEGKKLLTKWVHADPDETNYLLLTRQLSEFNKRALEVISNIKRSDKS